VVFGLRDTGRVKAIFVVIKVIVFNVQYKTLWKDKVLELLFDAFEANRRH